MANWRSVGGDSYTKPSLRENIGFTIMLFAVFGVVHLLWWSDHLMRMIQIYLGLTAFSVLIIGEALMDRIEDKLRRDQGFREILDQHREKEPE